MAWTRVTGFVGTSPDRWTDTTSDRRQQVSARALVVVSSCSLLVATVCFVLAAMSVLGRSCLRSPWLGSSLWFWPYAVGTVVAIGASSDALISRRRASPSERLRVRHAVSFWILVLSVAFGVATVAFTLVAGRGSCIVD